MLRQLFSYFISVTSTFSCNCNNYSLPPLLPIHNFTTSAESPEKSSVPSLPFSSAFRHHKLLPKMKILPFKHRKWLLLSDKHLGIFLMVLRIMPDISATMQFFFDLSAFLPDLQILRFSVISWRIRT